MAKTLEKVTKDFNLLFAQIGEVAQEVTAIGSDRIQLEAMARKAAGQAGQVAAELRKKGHTGKCLEDFRNDKEIKELLKLWDKHRSTAVKLEPRAAKASQAFPPLYEKLQAMLAELTEEIANRDKKANRKLFKIKSESLPDLKKLLTEIDKAVKTCDIKIETNAKDLPDDVVAEFAPTFEELFDEEFKKSAKERQKGDVDDLAEGAKNLRVQAKYLREGRQMQAEIKQLCMDAAKAAKNGDSPKSYLDSATSIYRRMNDVAKVQQQLLVRMGTRKNPTGDAKKLIDSAKAYVALSKATLAMITKVTSATMDAVGTRKGKEKV